MFTAPRNGAMGLTAGAEDAHVLGYSKCGTPADFSTKS